MCEKIRQGMRMSKGKAVFCVFDKKTGEHMSCHRTNQRALEACVRYTHVNCKQCMSCRKCVSFISKCKQATHKVVIVNANNRIQCGIKGTVITNTATGTKHK